MAIVGLGSDIVEIARIEQVQQRSGDRLARRILSRAELERYCHHSQPARYLAKRFAVKEAAAKALGTGMRNGVGFAQFEIFNDAMGKPGVRLSGKAAKIAAEKGVSAIHVTISDERHYACSTVIMEG